MIKKVKLKLQNLALFRYLITLISETYLIMLISCGINIIMVHNNAVAPLTPQIYV